MSLIKKKIELELIDDPIKRSGAFFRRRGGLMKKAYELAKLCDVHVGLIITDRKGHVHTFKTHEKIRLSASELDESHKRSRTNRKHFEYSEKDYPFNRVYKMSREIKEFGSLNQNQLTINHQKSLLSKRGEKLLGKFDLSKIEKMKAKKLLKIETKTFEDTEESKRLNPDQIFSKNSSKKLTDKNRSKMSEKKLEREILMTVHNSIIY